MSEDLSWVGVWELIQEADSGPTTFYVRVNPGGEIAVYSHLWNPLPLTRGLINGTEADFLFVVGRFRLGVVGERKGFRFEGSWKMFHPQYRIEGRMAGTKVVTKSGWDPLSGPAKIEENGLIDLTGVAAKQLSGSESDFESFWTRTKNELYAVLDSPPSAAELKKALNSQDAHTQASQFVQATRLAQSDLKALLPQADWSGIVLVSLPFGPRMTRKSAGDKSFVLVNVNKAKSAVQARSLAAEGMLSARLAGVLPTIPHPSFEMYRTGMPVLLAQESIKGAAEADVLALDASQLREIRGSLEELKSKLRAMKEIKVTDPLFGLSAQQFRVLSYGFARTLRFDRSLEEVVQILGQDVMRAYQKFIGNPPTI